MTIEYVEFPEEMISITKKEYDQLVKDSEWLSCLEQAGVDNWEGIEMAYEIETENKDTEDDRDSDPE